MSRAVSCDHILFDECIEAFRNTQAISNSEQISESYSYLLTDFQLVNPWHLPNCVVHPSITIRFSGSYSAFISRVDNPNYCDINNSHLFANALASIISFATGRSCKSTRDDLLYVNGLDEHYIGQIALLHPVCVAGPGATNSNLVSSTLSSYEKKISSFIAKVLKIEYDKYNSLMQSVRLVQLSINAKRDDFGLAYLLIISSLESIAQIVIKRDKVKKHPDESSWDRRAKSDPEFSKLLDAYKDARGAKTFLKERYIAFILKYAPVEDWESAVPHRDSDLLDSLHAISPEYDRSYLTRKKWYEKYPSDLDNCEILDLIGASYTHRSNFVHRGEQPPHKDPISSNRFFQEYHEYDERHAVQKLLPNYELLKGITQLAFFNWLDSLPAKR